MKLNQEEIDKIIQQLTSYSGIVPRDAHRTSLSKFVEERETSLADGDTEFSYSEYLSENPSEMTELVDMATVNETYFFREEKQFLLLKQKILPEIYKTTKAPIKIWSAACSSGEELYSLMLLADSCNIPCECFGSDINTKVLKKCRLGEYTKNSLRKGDGAMFHNLLSAYKDEKCGVELPQEIRNRAQFEKINLAKLSNPQSIFGPSAISLAPKNQDLIFVRNVFIYFSRELRKKILAALTEKCLVPGGYLFVSMNEIASLDSSLIPSGLTKFMDGKVFYFRKDF